jgi:hypothetical protein
MNKLTHDTQARRSILSTTCLDEKRTSLTARTAVREARAGVSPPERPLIRRSLR